MAVKVEEFKGSLRLRWTHEGKRYCLSPGLLDQPSDRLRAADIERDIEYGMFDTTLARYCIERPGKSYIKVW